jgi:hypothetical protein
MIIIEPGEPVVEKSKDREKKQKKMYERTMKNLIVE